ncbi:MAG: hypothetical protein AB3N34_02150 [Lettuce witches'-broom phytoplasma]
MENTYKEQFKNNKTLYLEVTFKLYGSRIKEELFKNNEAHTLLKAQFEVFTDTKKQNN